MKYDKITDAQRNLIKEYLVGYKKVLLTKYLPALSVHLFLIGFFYLKSVSPIYVLQSWLPILVLGILVLGSQLLFLKKRETKGILVGFAIVLLLQVLAFFPLPVVVSIVHLTVLFVLLLLISKDYLPISTLNIISLYVPISMISDIEDPLLIAIVLGVFIVTLTVFLSRKAYKAGKYYLFLGICFTFSLFPIFDYVVRWGYLLLTLFTLIRLNRNRSVGMSSAAKSFTIRFVIVHLILFAILLFFNENPTSTRISFTIWALAVTFYSWAEAKTKAQFLESIPWTLYIVHLAILFEFFRGGNVGFFQMDLNYLFPLFLYAFLSLLTLLFLVVTKLPIFGYFNVITQLTISVILWFYGHLILNLNLYPILFSLIASILITYFTDIKLVPLLKSRSDKRVWIRVRNFFRSIEAAISSFALYKSLKKSIQNIWWAFTALRLNKKPSYRDIMVGFLVFYVLFFLKGQFFLSAAPVQLDTIPAISLILVIWLAWGVIIFLLGSIFKDGYLEILGFTVLPFCSYLLYDQEFTKYFGMPTSTHFMLLILGWGLASLAILLINYLANRPASKQLQVDALE